MWVLGKRSGLAIKNVVDVGAGSNKSDTSLNDKQIDVRKCMVCLKDFVSDAALKVHMVSHARSSLSYACPVDGCAESFGSWHEASLHCQRVHGSLQDSVRNKKEHTVFTFIRSAFPCGDYVWGRNVCVEWSCWSSESGAGKRAFIDVYALVTREGRAGNLYIEVDEGQHKKYNLSCESLRMYSATNAVAAGGNTLPHVWIRFNPDARYTVDGNVTRTRAVDRLEALEGVIRELQFGDETPHVRTIYMFYDSVTRDKTTVPTVTTMPEYEDVVKTWLWKSIV